MGYRKTIKEVNTEMGLIQKKIKEIYSKKNQIYMNTEKINEMNTMHQS